MEIGVPTRFSTPRADIDVVTRAARAPALLTAYRLKGADNNQVDLHLQTGIRTADRETLASVCHGPFRTKQGYAAGHALPALPDVSYYLHSVLLSATLTAAHTGSSVGLAWDEPGDVAGTMDRMFEMVTVPLASGAFSISSVLDVVTLPNSDVDFFVNGTYSAALVTLTYAIVSGVM